MGNYQNTLVRVRRHLSLSPVYVCPMHPEIVKDQACECPKCDMALQPRVTQLLGVSLRTKLRKTAWRL